MAALASEAYRDACSCAISSAICAADVAPYAAKYDCGIWIVMAADVRHAAAAGQREGRAAGQ